MYTEDDWSVSEDNSWAIERAEDDESGFWIADEDDLGKEGEGWVVYESIGWKVRRLTRKVVRETSR